MCNKSWNIYSYNQSLLLNYKCLRQGFLCPFREAWLILPAAGTTWAQSPASCADQRQLWLLTENRRNTTFSVYACVLSPLTSVGGCLQRGWQLDAVVHPLSVTHPTCLAALNSLLHQEAEDITWILQTCAVPLWIPQHPAEDERVGLRINREITHILLWWYGPRGLSQI